jgi:hypothetical protein
MVLALKVGWLVRATQLPMAGLLSIRSGRSRRQIAREHIAHRAAEDLLRRG